MISRARGHAGTRAHAQATDRPLSPNPRRRLRAGAAGAHRTAHSLRLHLQG
jgi:hypothetical protein